MLQEQRGGLEEVGHRLEIDITSEAKISESSPTLNSGLKALRAFQTTAAVRASSKSSSHHSEFKRWSSGRRLRFGYEEGLVYGYDMRVVSSRFRWTGDEWEFGQV